MLRHVHTLINVEINGVCDGEKWTLASRDNAETRTHARTKPDTKYLTEGTLDFQFPDFNLRTVKRVVAARFFP